MNKNKEKPTVFLSSTFKDLQPHRKKVFDVLDSYGFEVRGMERFGARRTKPLDTCIKELHDSQIYLGIIGMVYGTVEQKSGKSYTQLEYEEAVKRDLEIYIYLFNESSGELPVKYIDFRHPSELKAFKEILKREHTPDYFTDADELAKKVNTIFKTIEPLPKPGFYREKMVFSRVTRFMFRENEEWFFVTGFQDGKPIEIFAGQSEGFFLPKWVKTGHISRNESQYKGGILERYDFHFQDKEGYKVTMQGLNRSYGPPSQLCDAITVLLRQNVNSIETIMEMSDKLDIANKSEKKIFLSALQASLLSNPKE